MINILGNKFYCNILFGVILALGVALSITVSALSYYSEKKLIQAEFNEAAENRHSALRRELDSDLAVLASLQALYNSSGKHIERSEFRNFTSHILKQHASIQALNWIPRVPDARREAYERAARREGFPDFQFTERIVQGKMKRAEKRKEYFPVYFVEPYKGNEIALGFDLASNPHRLETLEVARRTGEIRATVRIILVLEKTKGQFGFIVFAPIYRKGVLINSAQARWDNLEGFALGVFRISDIVEKAMNHLKPAGVDLFIHDASAPEKERFLYTHSSRTRKTPLLDQQQPETDFINSKAIEVAGRKWMVTYAATPDFISVRRSWRPWGILLAGLAFTGLVAGFLVIVRHAEYAEKSAKDLSDLNAKLAHEIMERKRADAVRKESHERLLMVLNSMDAAVYLADIKTYELLFINNYVRDIFGDIVGQPCWKTLQVGQSGPCAFCTNDKLLDAAGNPKGIYHWEFQNTVNGRWFDVHDRAIPWIDGRIVRMEIATDITDRKRMEEKLKESEASIRRLIENSPIAMVVDVGTDVDEKIIMMNKKFKELFGYTMEDVPDVRHWWPLAYPDVKYREEVRGEWIKRVEIAVKTRKEIGPMETTVTCKDGSTRHIKFYLSSIGDRNLIAFEDYTERKKMEEKLQESEDKYRALFFEARDGIVLIDYETGRITECNLEFETLTGRNLEQMKQMSIWELRPSEKVEAARKKFLEVKEEGTGGSSELEFQRPNGEVVSVEFMSKVIKIRGKMYIQSIVRDITERKQIEEEIMKLNKSLQRSLEELEVAYEDMESFSYSVSHDLRAPLRIIGGMSDILMKNYYDKLDDKGKNFLNLILENTKRMDQLILALLDLSKVGRKELKIVEIDMENAANLIAGDLKAMAPERNIAVAVGKLPPAHGDLALIRQVFANLLSNAIKFTKGRDVAYIEVGGRCEESENIYYVKDNGAGFNPELEEKLFKVFQRLHSAQEFEGIGIGLSIVYRIISRHNGRVWAEGRPDEGATFYFSLPRGK